MWGTLELHGRIPRVLRFIPTHVGNTRERPHRRGRAAVHPHACGEHGGLTARAARVSGSSPRMWGTHGERRFCLRADRFIPTHVGNTVMRGSEGLS